MKNMIHVYRKFSVLIVLMAFGFSGVLGQDYYSSTYAGKKINLGITLMPNMSWLRYGEQDHIKKQAQFNLNYKVIQVLFCL